jgi:hypothetical protein
MKKIGLTFVLGICLIALGQAQDYNTGIGLRGGFANGLTIKHFIGSKTAIEGIIATRWRGLELTGLIEVHNVAFNAERLKWYYGFGGHVGFWDGRYTYTKWGVRENTYTVIGLDGILGLEYSFSELPLNIGIDWKPAINLVGYTGFWADGGAVSFRFIF